MSTPEREKIGPTADAIVEKRLAEVAAAVQDVQREAAPEVAEKRLEAMPRALTDEAAATSQARAGLGVAANSDVPNLGAESRTPAVTGFAANSDVPRFPESSALILPIAATSERTTRMLVYNLPRDCTAEGSGSIPG